MNSTHRTFLLIAILSLALPFARAEDDGGAQQRAQAAQKMKDGNFKDAFNLFSALVLNPKDDPAKAGDDLRSAQQCLTNLNREDEVDALRDKALEIHAKNWRFLSTAAQTFTEGNHVGYIVAGVFSRGHRRGNGRYVSCLDRDRVRALQLFRQAQQVLPKSFIDLMEESDRVATSQFYSHFATAWMLKGYADAWKLQDLTDLEKLPDYEEGYYGYRGRGMYYGGGSVRGAPVDAAGNPVYYRVPKSFEAAVNDGERWRWTLAMAEELQPARRSELRFTLAQFLQSQFDVRTMAGFGRFGSDNDDKNESGPYAVKTLAEDETIARLANGIKRFKLPDEFNFIKIYQAIADLHAHDGFSNNALEALGALFEDRQQYDRAAEYWQRAITEFGADNNKQSHLDQIVKNWGIFEPSTSKAAGAETLLNFRFRNGKKVSFEAAELNVSKLLDDVKNYLKAKPKQLDWQQFNLDNIGYRIVEQNQAQYLGAKIAVWDLALEPRAHHFDRVVSVDTSLTKPGAYLVTAKMEDGNTSRIVVWVSDTAIFKKQLDKQSMVYVADSRTGNPVPNATLELFGYRQDWVNNLMHIVTKEDTKTTDGEGLAFLTQEQADNRMQWLIVAKTQDGRLAHLGFTGVWYGNYYDNEYNQIKTFGITDRPVYRPDQKVKFKFWSGYAKYDYKGPAPLAGQVMHVQVHNPKGEKIQEFDPKADEFGGIDGEFSLDKSAMLGTYSIHITGQNGSVNFRLEEYKKPEFEVKVDAPSEPLTLGEKVTATITAKYYFGAPVAQGKVKYKVLRYDHTANWYPAMRWDWFYEPGYWWFAADYFWYPGFREWGMRRPHPWWFGHAQTPPEVVLENEAPLNADGTFKVEIDTALAKAVHGDTDHRYELTAEVTDASRRTIVGTGSVIAARKPFTVYAWVDRGHYQTGDVINADFSAQTVDHKPVQGSGALKLLQVTYDKDGKPSEKLVQEWALNTAEDGRSQQKLKADAPGQYRLSYVVTDSKKHAIEGGYVFVVTGPGFNGTAFRFNDLELVPEKREYAPGEKVRLLVNTNLANTTVLLFPRAANGICLKPELLHLNGKSTVHELSVTQRDMPNFFIEAATIANGKVFDEAKEIVVPPESRVTNVEVLPSATELKPGQKVHVKLKLTDQTGEPITGTTTITVYDKSVEYISGGSNVPEIKAYFWKWRRNNYPQHEDNLSRSESNLQKSHETGMGFLGAFGAMSAIEGLDGGLGATVGGKPGFGGGTGRGSFNNRALSLNAGMDKSGGEMSDAMPAAPMSAAKTASRKELQDEKKAAEPDSETSQPNVEPSVRSNFADTAFWAATLNPNKEGVAEFDVIMPESLTTWKVKAWSMSTGTRVGQGETEIITKKNVIIRLQSPRFFTQKDEVIISANVHNFLKEQKQVTVKLHSGGVLEPMEGPQPVSGGMWEQKQVVEVPAGGETRVDWRVRVTGAGEAVLRAAALTNEESDAMELKFPAYIHGMLKTDSFSGNIRPDKTEAKIAFTVPAERRPADSRIEVRYSPTLAGAMVDALPYLNAYPYGCTEQTLSRFLPSAITQKVLLRMNINLKDVQTKLTNLNAQEIGDDVERAKQWGRDRFSPDHYTNPVFDEKEIANMVKAGVDRLSAMQCTDGGWGWFSGNGEYSSPHTTAYVVHGLQIAKNSGLALPANMLERGVNWLKNYQNTQLAHLRNAPAKTNPYKEKADNLDAFVYMVLVDGNNANNEMRDDLYRDRNDLAVYAKAMFGLALNKTKQADKLAMILENIGQYLVEDNENQTAYLKLPENNYWWSWYGSEFEAQAYYLKLLAATDAKSEKASRLVKYLINNRRHATYWNSTRDTAICVEALAEYLTASGEDAPDLSLDVVLDGKVAKTVAINASNLFTFDNKVVVTGERITSGAHTLEFRKKGTGPLYFNAYVSNFTLEDPIAKAGLEVKVERKYYKLKPVEKKISVEGAHGQSVAQRVEKYDRVALPNLSQLKSGDLVEIELEIESKNDYEYLVFEDMKAAGFEPVEVRSGYNPNDMGAYMELRDERVCFFVRQLARGKHSVAYRMRAEIPGTFSALPTRASAMYAPELKANSDEIKMKIAD